MKTILITGLDGSGKSTIFEKMKQQAAVSKVKFLFVPHIDLSEFSPESQEFKVATCINEMSAVADREQLTQIKAVALFSAMLFFKKLLDFQQISKPEIIFFERHPLIDTSIYAQFYAPKLAQNTIPTSVNEYFESNYSHELDFLIQLLPKQLLTIQKPKLTIFTDFIYTWFFVEKQNTISDLQTLFGVELPTKIYYLKADAPILYQRIKSRARKEAHENELVLSKLAEAYENYLTNLAQSQPNLIEFIDANNLQSLDNFAEKLLLQLKG